MNRVNIMGRLTADPELKKTPNNISVTSFTIAQGKNEKTQFLDCVAWRNTAEFIVKHFSKGRMIAIDGSLQTRTWEDRNGSKHKAVEIIVNEVDFADSQKPQEKPQEIPQEELSDDLPF